jgi:hypothetical protein
MPSCGHRGERSCPLEAPCYEWEDDGQAWTYLEDRGFTHDRFLVKPPRRDLTAKEGAALCFLVNEWDWAIEED